MAKPISKFRQPGSRGPLWTLVLVAVLSAGNAVRQYFVGHGAVPKQLAGLWGLIALSAAVAAWGTWRRSRWAVAAAVVWAVVTVAVTVVGTALLFRWRPPVLSVLPGTALAALLGWLVVRGLRRTGS
jgi:hypothetical protein